MDRRALVQPWIEFLGRWSWDWFATFTFRGDYVHPERADKLWRVWVSKANRALHGVRWYKHGRGLHWVRCLETQRRDVLHYHALLGGVQDLRRLSLMDTWDELAGFARITPIQDPNAVTAYCAKYVAKSGELELGGPLGQIPLGLPKELRRPLVLQHSEPTAEPHQERDRDELVYAQSDLPGVERQPELFTMSAGVVTGAPAPATRTARL